MIPRHFYAACNVCSPILVALCKAKRTPDIGAYKGEEDRTHERKNIESSQGTDYLDYLLLYIIMRDYLQKERREMSINYRWEISDQSKRALPF